MSVRLAQKGNDSFPNITKTPAPRPPVDVKRRIVVLRSQLLRAAVRYVVETPDAPGNTRGDRIRTASSLSGIPVNLIAVEVEKIR